MLDEILEYNQYTGNIKNARFDVKTATNKERFVGLDRPMTIIARQRLTELGFFDDESEITDEERNNKILPMVSFAVRVWTGFCEDSELPYNGWFKKYFLKIHAEVNDGDKKLANTLWNEFVQESSKMDLSLFFLRKAEENYMLSSTFEKIVAEAVCKGPLKRYYLVCKPGFAAGLYKLSKDGTPKPLKLDNAKDAELADNFLRLISVYLIEKNRTGQEWCHINNADLSHWARCFQISKNPRAYYEKIHYQGNSIVGFDTIANSYAKRYILPEYLQAYDFQVVEADGFDASLYPGYVRYEDQGSGKPLKRKKL